MKISNTLINLLGLCFLTIILQSSSCGNDPDYSEPNALYGTPGPAGGIIFYDKGSYSDGWRYMEITAFSIGDAPWGCLNQDLPMCNEIAMGKGLENTTNILAAQTDTTPCYYVPTAAKLCSDYSLNGYSDWFLPSSGELEQAVENLKILHVGGFYTYEQMWSSTEGWGNWFDGTTAVQGCHAWRVVVYPTNSDDNASSYETSKAGTLEVRAVRRY